MLFYIDTVNLFTFGKRICFHFHIANVTGMYFVFIITTEFINMKCNDKSRLVV